MSKKYQKPPVVEALCELYCEGSEWDETVPGRFYDQVKGEFPQRKQIEALTAHFVSGTEGGGISGFQPRAPTMQFLSESPGSVLQLRRDMLVVNQLRPYPHFEIWEPKIYKALKVYWDLTSPKGVRRIGLRYINRIAIPQTSGRVLMEDYFNLYPQVPKETGSAHGSFLLQIQLPCAQAGHSVFVSFGSAPDDNPSHSAFFLDLYGTFEGRSLLDRIEIQPVINAAHENLKTAFEGSITEKLRILFEPIP